MSTAVTPALETSGGSATPVGVDPVDALDMSDMVEEGATPLSEHPIPESMIIGGKREGDDTTDDGEGDDAARRADGRNEKGQFAKSAKDEADTVPPAPFKYRAMGQTHEMEGATMDAQGNVMIPATKIGELRDAMNARHLINGEFRPLLERERSQRTALEQQVKELSEARSASDAKAEQLVNTLSQVMAEPDDDKALQMLWNLRSNWGTLTARAEAEHYKQQLERAAKRGQPAPKPDTPSTPSNTMPAPDAARATTTEYIERLKLDPKYRAISDADWKQFADDTHATPFAFIRLATADDATKYGIPEQSIVFDTDMLDAAVEKFANARTTERATADARSRLAADNARRTQPSVQAPPTPGSGRAPAKPKGGASIKSKSDFDQWLESDEI